MAYDFDLFVIGAGSGGVRAARISASYGAKVACAEDTHLGGTCVNVGCVPKKLFVYGSHYSHDFIDSAAYGWDVESKGFSWPTLRDNKNREIERLNGIYKGLLDGAGVTTLHGTATITGPHEVSVDGKSYSTERILVATGGEPFVPQFPGSELAITSNEAFYLEQFPQRALVVGGGYIAVEFAGIFNGLGVTTQLAYRGDMLLRGFDNGVRQFVTNELVNSGIDVVLNANVVSIEEGSAGTRIVQFADGTTGTFDLVLYATGRRPRIAGLGLEALGVELTAGGAVQVDDYFQTSVPSVYALGDVIDRFQLTPVAISEAMCLAANLFKGARRVMDYTNIPTAVFCQPSIGTVGLTEEEAEARFGRVDVYQSEFKPMKHTLTGRNERTLMKLIVNPETDVVVGAHMVGPDAGEIIQGLGVALKAGATKAQFDATVGIHPTAAEEFVTMREVRASQRNN